MDNERWGKQVVIRILVALGAIAAISATAQTARPPIKVGAMIPLTGSGATVGESGQIAVELAVRNINAAGGIAGRQVQLVIGDYQTEATVGVSEAKRLIFQEKIELLVGPTYSQVTLAVLPLLNEAKIPSVNVSGSERLTPEVGPYAFSMLANAEAQVKGDGRSRGPRDEGAVGRHPVGQPVRRRRRRSRRSRPSLPRATSSCAGVQEYQYRQADMTPQLLALRRGAPDVILLFTSNGEDTGNMIKSMNELGWGVKVVGSFGATFSGPGAQDRGQGCVQEHRRGQLQGLLLLPERADAEVVPGLRRAGEGVQAGGLRAAAARVSVALVRRRLRAEDRGRGDRRQDGRPQRRGVARDQFEVVPRHQQRTDRQQIDALPDRAGRA